MKRNVSGSRGLSRIACCAARIASSGRLRNTRTTARRPNARAKVGLTTIARSMRLDKEKCERVARAQSHRLLCGEDRLVGSIEKHQNHRAQTECQGESWVDDDRAKHAPGQREM